MLTELSIADYAKLLGAGIEPIGIAAWSSVCFVTYLFGGGVVMQPAQMSGPSESYELREFTRAIYAAREQVMKHVGAQAQSQGASGIVGVRISHSISRQTVGESSRVGLLVTFHAIGTAVRDTATAAAPAPKPTIDMTA